MKKDEKSRLQSRNESAHQSKLLTDVIVSTCVLTTLVSPNLFGASWLTNYKPLVSQAKYTVETETTKENTETDKKKVCELSLKPARISHLDSIIDETPLGMTTDEAKAIIASGYIPEAEDLEAINARHEAEEEAKWFTVLVTAYSSADYENGGYGAVDCRTGKSLPDNAVAADLSVFPYGTRLEIEGYGEKVVCDTASASTLRYVNKRADKYGAVGWLDLYIGDDPADAEAFGVQLLKVKIIE